MKRNSLKAKNRYLKASKARQMRIRSLASSTAIETRESVSSIEAKLNRPKRSSRRRVSLA